MKMVDKILLRKKIKKLSLNYNSQQFINSLLPLTDEEILFMMKDKKILTYFNNNLWTSSDYNYNKENGIRLEHIEALLVKKGLRNIKYSHTDNLDIWQDYLKKHPMELIYYSGILNDELRNILIDILDKNPELIIKSRISDDIVISNIFKKYNINIPLEKTLSRISINNAHNLLKNKYSLKQILIQHQKEIKEIKYNDIIHSELSHMIREDINTGVENNNFIEKWDYILSDEKIDKSLICDFFSKCAKEFFYETFKSSKFFCSKLFTLLLENISIEQIRIFDYIKNEELIKILTIIYKKNKNSIKLVNNNYISNSCWEKLFNEFKNFNNISEILSIFAKCTKEEKSIAVQFCIMNGIKITKDEILKEDDLYNNENILNYINESDKKLMSITFEEFLNSNRMKKNKSFVIYLMKNGTPNAIYYYNGKMIVSLYEEVINDPDLCKYFNSKEITLFKLVISLNKKNSDRIDDFLYLFKNDNYIDKNKINFYINNGKPSNKLVEKLIEEKKLDILNVFIDEDIDEIYKKIIETYNNLQKDYDLKKIFEDIISKTYKELTIDKIKELEKIIELLIYSNSLEIYNLRKELAIELLNTDNPLDNFKKIENVFIKNNIPTVGKIFLCFDILHPNFKSYNFGDKDTGSNVVSPVLRSKKNTGRKITIFSDLIKSSFGTNNREVLNYINSIEEGNKLYNDIIENKIKYEDLDNEKQLILINFRNHLATLYSNTTKGNTFNTTNNIIKDINELATMYPDADKSLTSLSDKIVSSFCHFAGFDTVEEVKKYIYIRTLEADTKNRNRANNNDFTIEKGDFVKGFDIGYLETMLQNGINACDYLGAYQHTDATALDTDLSRIFAPSQTINETITKKDADTGFFGQGYIIIKNNPNRIAVTKINENEDYIVDDVKSVNGRLEAFATGATGKTSNAYGIRTGFSASDIDYIVFNENGGTYKDNIDKLRLAIALNGFYIPIISKSDNKLLFSPKDYDLLRTKMSGLSFYNENKYSISNNLSNPNIDEIVEVIDESKKYVDDIKNKIITKIKLALEQNGFNVSNEFSKDLDYKTIQIIDTGSTSRYTCTPYDSDYDFIFRIDKEIFSSKEKLNNLRNMIINSLKTEEKGVIVDDDIKELKIIIDGKTIPIDISFTQKSDKISYSSEMCVEDRLNTIKKLYPEKYTMVLANIIYAKKYLKENEVYKKGMKQGGLGGIGVENWILENGGSFYDAAKSFLNAASLNETDYKSYENFTKDYEIWDFGQNYYTERKNAKNGDKHLLYDNFIKQNLTQDGYQKMIIALNKYVLENKEVVKEEFNKSK